MLTQQDYCDYETSRALAELGISHCGMHFYEKGYGMTLHHNYMQYLNVRTAKALDRVLAIPLYSAQKWLREELNIIVEVFVDDDSDTPITYNIHKDGECVFYHHGRYFAVKDWNLALLEGIKQSINILKDGI